MCTLLDREGVGLAAPQVGVPKRLIVVKCKDLGMPRLTEFDTKVQPINDFIIFIFLHIVSMGCVMRLYLHFSRYYSTQT